LDSENPDEIQAQGRGGQRLFIFKDRNMVVVIRGGGYDHGDIDDPHYKLLKRIRKTK